MNTNVIIKTDKEVEIMRKAGKLLSKVISQVASAVRPGISTLSLDDLAEKLIINFGAKPAFKGYGQGKNRYPATLCTSVNEEVVHGIPRRDKILKEGDIIGLDCGLIYNGYFSDMAITVPVGKISYQAEELIRTTKKSLNIAIQMIKPGIRLGNISSAIQSCAEENNFSVVRTLTGHGIGKELHEPPVILNYGIPNTGITLEKGMTLCFEPMFNAGDWRVKTLKDGWTIVTSDNSLSAHFEHMILVTKSGAEVLTKFN
ncbi:type I methionyl aminopeptidase [bacterium]|nr:type I methionyl aminopeptidase [bacterium]